MKWAETESAFLIYKHYLDKVILEGKVVITTVRADSLAHTIRAVIKGCQLRNHIPYSALKGNIRVKIGINTVTLLRGAGAPAISPISDREYRIMAPTTYNEVLATIGRMKNDELDRAAFLAVSDLDESKITNLQKVCTEAEYTFSCTNNTVVIIK